MRNEALRQKATIARRKLILGGAVGALLLPALRRPRAQPAEPKMSQADANYQAMPNYDQKCSVCTKFQPPHGCSVVVGDISPEGWCRLYEEPPE